MSPAFCRLECYGVEDNCIQHFVDLSCYGALEDKICILFFLGFDLSCKLSP